MISTRSGRTVRPGIVETSPPRTRKGVSPNRSPARARKSSPARKYSPPPRKSSPARKPSSPGRKSSPSGRSTTRKSPARKSPSRKSASQYPARKSPSRATKETPETAPKSPARRPIIRSRAEVKLEDVSTKYEAYRRQIRRTDYSIMDIQSNIQNDTGLDKLNGYESSINESKDIYSLRNRKLFEEVVPRRSSRLRDFIENVPDIRRSFTKSPSKSVSKSISQSIGTFSDEEHSADELHTEKSLSVTRKLSTPLRDNIGKMTLLTSRWEFGGRIGTAMMMMLMPLTVFSILVSCTKYCSLKPFSDLSTYKTQQAWFSVPSALFIFVQIIVQYIFAVLPVGGVKSDGMDSSKTVYHFNALLSCIVTITILFTLDYFRVFNSNDLLNDYLKLATMSYVFAVVLSIVVSITISRKMKATNVYGNTGYTLYDFFIGKEIHPALINVDVKIWLSRISNITTIILAVLIFKQGFHVEAKDIKVITLDNYKDVVNAIQLNPSILVYSMMQIVYILHFIMSEYKVTSSFFWQSEGVGYLLIVSRALYPYYFTSISKFVADTELTLSTNTLITATVLYFLGFIIMLASNNIKYQFRKNPLNPKLSNLESMPTFHGKKLLISGLWGTLRHPNYAGDILVHIAFALPGILSKHYIATAPALLTILVLLHRAWRDHVRCKRRYGTAWQRYCQKVPSVIIPKIL